MEEAALLAPQPGCAGVVGRPVAPAVEALDLDLLGAGVGADHDLLAQPEERDAEDRGEEGHRDREAQRAHAERQQPDQFAASRELGDEERGGDDQRRRRELVGDHRGLVQVELADRPAPGAPREAVRAVGEVDDEIDEHHPAQRRREEPGELAQQVPVELAEEPLAAALHASRAAMSWRSCIPAKESRATAP